MATLQEIAVLSLSVSLIYAPIIPSLFVVLLISHIVFENIFCLLLFPFLVIAYFLLLY